MGIDSKDMTIQILTPERFEEAHSLIPQDRQQCLDEEGILAAACIGSRIVAVLGMLPQDEYLFILSLTVEEEYRRMGIASELLKEAARVAQAMDAVHLTAVYTCRQEDEDWLRELFLIRGYAQYARLEEDPFQGGRTADHDIICMADKQLVPVQTPFPEGYGGCLVRCNTLTGELGKREIGFRYIMEEGSMPVIRIPTEQDSELELRYTAQGAEDYTGFLLEVFLVQDGDSRLIGSMEEPPEFVSQDVLEDFLLPILKENCVNGHYDYRQE